MISQRTRWEEYEVTDLGRLMIQASALEDAVKDTDLVWPSDDDREALRDAAYHAHKAYWLLSNLAIKAEREWKELVSAEESGKASK